MINWLAHDVSGICPVMVATQNLSCACDLEGYFGIFSKTPSDHAKCKNGQNLKGTFFTSTFITFVILPIFSNQTHFQKVDVQDINCRKRFLHKLSLYRRNQEKFEDLK